MSCLLTNYKLDRLLHQHTPNQPLSPLQLFKHANTIDLKAFPRTPVKLGLEHLPGESIRIIPMLDQIHTGLANSTLPSPEILLFTPWYLFTNAPRTWIVVRS